MIKQIFGTLIVLIFCAFLSAQDFDLRKFSSPQKYGWKNFDERIKHRNQFLERQQLLQVYKYNKQEAPANMLISTIFPGWGHFATNNDTKGQILLGMQICLFGSSIYFFDQAFEYHQKYKKSTQIDEMNQYYNDSLTPYRYGQVFGGIFAIVWAYTIYDAKVVTDEYNSNLWKKIMKEYNKQKLKITPTGISYQF